VPGEQHERTWTIIENRIGIYDREFEEGMEYTVEKIDREELVILWGSANYKLKYTRVKKQ
jgi:hypothetical protein